MPYGLRSQLSSRNGQAQIKITNRSCIHQKTCNYSGCPEDFDKYLINLIGACGQRGAQYLGNPSFYGRYIEDPSYIDSEECYDTYGHSPQQLTADIGWLYSILLTTLNDANIPAITTVNGDGIFALENLKAEFTNAGLGEQQLDWKIEDELNIPYDPNKVTYSAIQMDCLYPNQYDNKRKLSLLRKNFRLISSSVSYLFDKIETEQTHWLQAIRFLQLKFPDSIKNGTTTGNHL